MCRFGNAKLYMQSELCSNRSQSSNKSKKEREKKNENWTYTHNSYIERVNIAGGAKKREIDILIILNRNQDKVATEIRQTTKKEKAAANSSDSGTIKTPYYIYTKC